MKYLFLLLCVVFIFIGVVILIPLGIFVFILWKSYQLIMFFVKKYNPKKKKKIVKKSLIGYSVNKFSYD